jgi:hypothetical protein
MLHRGKEGRSWEEIEEEFLLEDRHWEAWLSDDTCSGNVLGERRRTSLNMSAFLMIPFIYFCKIQCTRSACYLVSTCSWTSTVFCSQETVKTSTFVWLIFFSVL